MQEWFNRKVEYTKDSILGTYTSFVDIGATVYEALTIVAQSTSSGTKDQLEAKLGQSGTLEDDMGNSVTAVLVSVKPIRLVKPSVGVYRVELTFEALE
jgi:hypothetical protein